MSQDTGYSWGGALLPDRPVVGSSPGAVAASVCGEKKQLDVLLGRCDVPEVLGVMRCGTPHAPWRAQE
ncbi:hypothetical protein QJS66_09165 [Kocuria rhizophila]|nr:hypothetical protein QJS66_09165 [Kocuria rhizophila]